MIPHRISVSGFFSYKDPQDLDFDGSPLWMLTGKNGSGKSTIFDAVTYTLFGYHRGGSQMAVELINKDAKGLTVEFDFWIDNTLYQARRTLRRNPKGGASGTQQLSRWDPDPISGQGHWVPIADTSKRIDFERWIEEHIGLNYETFTSSVLLLQGRAEKLLDSKPSGRAEVLAGIVDLKRYQLLHEKADTRRKALKGQCEFVQNQVDALGEVSPLDVALAEEKIEQMETAFRTGQNAVEQLQLLEFQARGWRDLRTRLATKREKLAQVEALLGDALVIEKDYRRFCELREVLPHINAIQQLQAAIEESDSRTSGLLARNEEIGKRKLELEHAHDLGRKTRASLQSTLGKDETRQRTVESQLRELEGTLARVRLFEEHQGKLEKLTADLKRIPPTPDEAVRNAQKALDERNELGKIVLVLERFSRHRQALLEFQNQKAKADKETLSITQKGEKASKELADLQAQGKTAAEAKQRADEQATEARTILQQAKAALNAFQTLKGAKNCSQCGQKLTAKHYQEEIERREGEVKTADEASRKKTTEQTENVKRDAELRKKIETAVQLLADLRSKYKDHETVAKQAEKDIERTREECRRAYLELAESFRLLIAPTQEADWPNTTYPSADDLRKHQRDAGDLDLVKRQLRDAQDVAQRHANLSAQVATTQESLNKLKADLPPGDPATLRANQSGLQAEEKGLAKTLQATRWSLQENEGELERLSRELDGVKQDLSGCHNQLSTEETRRKGDQDSIERTRKLLPESWRQLAATAGLTDQLRWKVERDDLDAKRAEPRYQQLALARGGLDSLREEVKEAEAAEAAVAPEARREPEEVHALLELAKQDLIEREKAFQTARQEKGILDHNRQRREELQKTALEHDKEFKYYRLLAETLGRDRLQLFLLRTAERQIVDHANAVLDRLSEGHLYLTLRAGPDGTNADSALDMEAYNRVTGEKPINVAFLSGSQRFRVAVSLALGIGQYASRQHRPIESVIIDEGFGCLDREGRQVMIQELQNLRGQLQCILLVSHQEEFADAFNNGYRFELRDGATKVTRFQR